MERKNEPRILPLILTSLVVLLVIQPCLCQNDQQYETCRQPFRCGSSNTELAYPFWGGDRPPACGYPGFELNCGGGDAPLLNMPPLLYRVLDFNNSTQTVRVSRGDLWSNICPQYLFNTTLNFSLFDFYSAADDQNITLHYGCGLNQSPLNPPVLPNQFNCNVNRTNSWSWFFTRDASGLGDGVTCSNSIFVPVNQNAARDLGVVATTSPTLLQSALASGFSIRWSAENDNCDACATSGGACGYDRDAASFVCYCSDGRRGSSCSNDITPPDGGNGNSGSKLGTKIGLPIGGAVLAGVGLGWLIFYCRQRRKQHLQRLASQSTKATTSKEITNPSSKPLSTTLSTNFSTSVPSYPSSKSDLGRGSTYFGVQVFSYEDLEEATDSFNASRELGDGGFGTVYYGVLSDGRIVAVKRLYENNFKRVEQFMNEVEILTRLRHKNLVVLFGCTSRRSRELLLVYEYIPNGTVADHLHGKRAGSGLLSWPVRLNIAIETAEALSYLHISDVIHRDVKTNNILLDNDFHVKVADFGLSRLFPNDVTHVSTAPQGTPGYVDPEYYQCYQLTEKSDVYSFGVVLIELISSLQAVDTNRHRHDINLANMAVNKIQNHTLHELVDSSIGFETNTTVRRMATLVSELAFRCLQQDRETRPSMEEVVEALRGIQNEDMNSHRVDIVDILVDGDVGPPGSIEKSGGGSTPNSSG
ncbi:hypothetical protein ACP275_08G071600 [Erythranthe tilingii]